MAELTIGQLAKRARVNVETVRYYERRGLVMQPVRPRSGYRRYGDETVSGSALSNGLRIWVFRWKRWASCSHYGSIRRLLVPMCGARRKPRSSPSRRNSASWTG